MNNKLEQKTRLDWIDIVKFWGILAITWGHTLSGGDVHQYLYSFHVPLFFFVIGLFFTPPKISFWQFTAKKAVALLIPYFSFAIISILIFSVLGQYAVAALGRGLSDNSLFKDLLEMLTGKCRANRPLWFLPSMFLCYLLCFGLARIIEKKSIRVKYSVAILVILVSIAFLWVNESILKIQALFWKIDVAIFMLAFVAAAFLMKTFFMKHFKLYVYVLLSLSLLLVGGKIAFMNSVIGYLSNNYGNIFLFFMSAMCTIVGFCFISIVLTQRNLRFITKPLAYVGRRTLPVLLMHKFPILFFQVIFPWTKQPMKANNAIVGFVVAVISIIACLTVDIVFRKLFRALLMKKNKESIQENT